MGNASIFRAGCFEHTFADLGQQFFAPATPKPAAEPVLIHFNSGLAKHLGLDVGAAHTPQTLACLAGNALPLGAKPLAQVYAGHQFGHFNPQLGDGRALLLGERVATNGQRYDIQLKGAGVTPYSRNGDGRAAIGPVVREYVVSEAMHALGVETTRALAAVATGNWVYRHSALPGAVLTRVATSHIRVEYFARKGNMEAVKTLADYVIARHYPQCAAAPNPYLALLQAVMAAQAQLVAHWLSLGFIHGVMNTDNCSISGETIDYGPCAFMDTYNPHTFYSAIDTHGRYAYDQQRAIIQWNLARLAECLLRLFDADTERAVTIAEAEIAAFMPQFEREWLARFAPKLGFVGELVPDMATEVTHLANALLVLMAQYQADFTLVFRRLGLGFVSDDLQAFIALFDAQAKPELVAWLARWQALLLRQNAKVNMPPAAYLQACGQQMLQLNPAIIPRNYWVEQVIDAAIAHDFAPMQALNAALTTPFDTQWDSSPYARPPADGGANYQTFCGT